MRYVKLLFSIMLLGIYGNVFGEGFSSPIDVNAGTYGHSAVDAGDINLDGRTDVLLVGGTAHGAGKVFAWVEQTSDGKWIKHDINPNKSLRKFLGSAKLADFDNDGDLDVAVSSDRHSGSTKEAEVWVFINPGKANVTGNWAYKQITSKTMPWHHINDMEIADMDDDGKLDVVCRSLYPNQIHIFFQNNLSSWTRKSINTQLDESEGLAVGRLNGDRFPDIEASGFWYKSPSSPRSQSYARLKMDSNYHTVNQNTKEAIGDIDGDGKLDVLMGPAESFRKGGDHYLAWYKNPGSNNDVNWSKKIIVQSTNRMHQVKLADMDNDGDLDAVTGQAWDPKSIKIFYNDGKGNFSSPNIVISGKGLYSSSIIDMDKDGDLDIVGCENYTGKTYMYRNQLSVVNPPPVISISADKTTGFTPLTVNFSATASDSDGIASYKWTFGDGSSSTNKNPSHTYSTAGIFTAKLVVTDNKGAKSSKTIKITVEEEIVDPDPDPVVTKVDDNNSKIVYSGTWGLDKANKYSKGAYNDTLHWSKEIGAKATLSFTGTYVSLYCKTATNGNVIRVSVDGGAYKEINLNGNGEQQQKVFARTGLSYGTHTIQVECRGSAVHLDFFEYGGEDTSNPDPDPEPSPVYSAKDFISSNNINTKGHVKANSWLGYNVDFGSGNDTVKLKVSSGRNGGTVECRLGSKDGEIIGRVYVPNTGGWYQFIDVHCFVGDLSGSDKIFFTFDGGLKTLLDIEEFSFVSSSSESGKLEAEEAVLSDANIESALSGFSGSGYAVLKANSFAGWSPVVSKAGKYTLTFDYSLLAENAELDLLVNDKFIPSSMLFTEENNWGTFSVDVELTAGENTVILSNGSSTVIEIDKMEIRKVE